MNAKILAAIFRKDLTCLLPLLSLAAALFLADALIVRLNVLPTWSTYNQPVLLVGLVVVILAIFQQDSPASLTDDFLCRPLGKLELIGAKLLLVLCIVYLPRVLGVLIADLALGYPLLEALPDAWLVQEEVLLSLAPGILFTAIVTRTFVQGVGVLFAMLICVFVIPTPFVRPPGPLSLGQRDELYFSGMFWLATMPAKIACVLLLAVGFWLAYQRRRLNQARVLLAATLCVAMFFLLLPMAIVPGTTTFAAQKASGSTRDAGTEAIFLRPMQACFPATRRKDLGTDAAFAAASRSLWLWDGEALGDSGPDSVAFITDVEARGLPLDWRVKLNHVQAEYVAGGDTHYSLRPSQYFNDRGELLHAWLLPEVAVRKLASAGPELRLHYSLTLLKPREYSLATDGARHALAGLGYCGATVDEPGNRIEVDCFSAFSHPAQLSAGLKDVPANSDYTLSDLSPGWTQWPYGLRAKLTIPSPRLAKHDTVTVTAWEVAGYLDESLVLPGLLGADLSTCPLPDVGSREFAKSRWRDAAPHEVYSITVDAGVTLEVLDFGGSGSPLVLLPGLGATAHSFDELAPQLAKTHRVVAITRRGSGYSSKPDFGFDTPRLAQDVLAVMDEMKLPKALLVGHSIAGDELTWMGGHHPERFTGLVYLDAAYDRAGTDARNTRMRELYRSLPPEPPIPPPALLNYDALSEYLAAHGHARLAEGELIASLNIDKPFVAGTPSIDARTRQAITAAIQSPDYEKVKIPALAIYAFEAANKPLPPWYNRDDPELIARLTELGKLDRAMKRDNIEAFKRGVANAEVIEMPNASHYLIQSNQPEVLQAIEAFAARLPAP